MRPPLANHRLRWLSSDELLLTLKRRWADGTTHIVLSPSELLARLAALVPPRGFNLTRYHGCLAPRSGIRDLIVPAQPAPAPDQLEDDPEKSPTGDRVPEPPTLVPARPRRIPLAELLHRVFRSEVDKCKCGGRLKLLAFVTDLAQARRYLEHVGLPSEVPAIAPARAPPQADLDFDPC
ncbi:MAG: transposase [Pseudomonadota bacterium]